MKITLSNASCLTTISYIHIYILFTPSLIYSPYDFCTNKILLRGEGMHFQTFMVILKVSNLFCSFFYNQPGIVHRLIDWIFFDQIEFPHFHGWQKILTNFSNRSLNEQADTKMQRGKTGRERK